MQLINATMNKGIIKHEQKLSLTWSAIDQSFITIITSVMTLQNATLSIT